MEQMRQCYSLDSQESNKAREKGNFWHSHKLEEGVWLIQNAGELLFTPSIAPHAVFTLTWSVLITAHVETAVTFVRNLKHQRAELAFDGSENKGIFKRMYLCLHEITPARLGIRTFEQLRQQVGESWPGIEGIVREKASRQEWEEIVLALQKMFKTVERGQRPDCLALRKSSLDRS
jgi:hypothetical protein